MSPYSVQKALENTAVPVGSLPEDKLSTGQGLMQVDKLDFPLWAFAFYFYFYNFEKEIEFYVTLEIILKIIPS